jgi:hypothetical protein
MILPDVNVLIYAFRRDSVYHSTCKTWLDSVITGHARFGIAPLALSAVIRITTGLNVYQQPSSLAEAFAYCRNLLHQPHCDVVEPGERHWEIFERLSRQANISGARITDAWFAALAIEHGCTWISYDRDFARFPGLDWRLPEA